MPENPYSLLAEAARQFRFYERQHRDKGVTGHEKAQVNREWAERLENAVAAFSQTPCFDSINPAKPTAETAMREAARCLSWENKIPMTKGELAAMAELRAALVLPEMPEEFRMDWPQVASEEGQAAFRAWAIRQGFDLTTDDGGWFALDRAYYAFAGWVACEFWLRHRMRTQEQAP